MPKAYLPASTLKTYRQKHGVSTSFLAIVVAFEAMRGFDYVTLARQGFRAPIDQAAISNAENGRRVFGSKAQQLLAAVISKLEKREVTIDELFPEYRGEDELILAIRFQMHPRQITIFDLLRELAENLE